MGGIDAEGKTAPKTWAAGNAKTLSSPAVQMLLRASKSGDAQFATSSYTDLNPWVRAYCDTLGVEIGSDLWRSFGSELYASQTGGQADFGWRQDHRIPPVSNPRFERVAKAILSNAGYRPIFYLDDPDALRKGYGRPWDWLPDSTIDDPLTEGWKSPNGKLVTGYGAQHISLKFIAALAAVPTPNEYSEMARAFLWRNASVVGGWLRTSYYHDLHSSREVGRMLDLVCDAVEHAWIDPYDGGAILDWTENVVLAQIQPNGIGYVLKPTDQGYKPEPNLGAVPYWYPWQDGLMVGGMYRFGVLLQESPLGDLQILGQKVIAMARKVAGNMASVITDDGACPKAVGLDGKVSWVENEKYGYAVWCYRALRIAGAHEKANAVFERFKSDPSWWPWFVEADGSWNPNLPMAK